MRFGMHIDITGELPIRIPVTYRMNFMSMIKEAINPGQKDTPIYQQYYGEKKQNQQKPFTFCVNLPVSKVQDRTLVLADHRIKFHFSSCDPVFLIHVYNGMVQMKNDFSLFSGYSIHITHFFLHRQTTIDSDEVVFKTLSPFLVRNINAKKGKGFIGIDHEAFSENLFFSIQNLAKHFLDKTNPIKPEQVRFEAVKCKSSVIRHYGGEIGTSGIFKLKAPKEVLQLVYDAGIGAKRAQGFGMVEVVG